MSENSLDADYAEVQEQDDELVEGETPDEEEEVPTVSYDVTSYGSDPEVETLVSRLGRGDLIIPSFQRDYVWRQPEASKFIESLLLGLPVPGVFFATEPETNKQLVIDGQQRLKTLKFFYDGFFNPKEGQSRQRVFSLIKVQKPFEGKTYKTLDETDRMRLDTSIIHATIIKQSSPPGDNTSLYHVFERLNSGGRRLTDQEMRVALYHGSLIDRIKELNDYPNWRKVFGKPHSRLKDQELILRFLALFDGLQAYEKPMVEFLNKYAGKNRNPDSDYLDHITMLFQRAIDQVVLSLPDRPFRLVRSLNVAIFDSCMVGIANRIDSRENDPIDSDALKDAYANLILDEGYIEAVSSSTADVAFVQRRVSKAVNAFANC